MDAPVMVTNLPVDSQGVRGDDHSNSWAKLSALVSERDMKILEYRTYTECYRTKREEFNSKNSKAAVEIAKLKQKNKDFEQKINLVRSQRDRVILGMPTLMNAVARSKQYKTEYQTESNNLFNKLQSEYDKRLKLYQKFELEEQENKSEYQSFKAAEVAAFKSEIEEKYLIESVEMHKFRIATKRNMQLKLCNAVVVDFVKRYKNYSEYAMLQRKIKDKTEAGHKLLAVYKNKLQEIEMRKRGEEDENDIQNLLQNVSLLPLTDITICSEPMPRPSPILPTMSIKSNTYKLSEREIQEIEERKRGRLQMMMRLKRQESFMGDSNMNTVRATNISHKFVKPAPPKGTVEKLNTNEPSERPRKRSTEMMHAGPSQKLFRNDKAIDIKQNVVVKTAPKKAEHLVSKLEPICKTFQQEIPMMYKSQEKVADTQMTYSQENMAMADTSMKFPQAQEQTKNYAKPSDRTNSQEINLNITLPASLPQISRSGLENNPNSQEMRSSNKENTEFNQKTQDNVFMKRSGNPSDLHLGMTERFDLNKSINFEDNQVGDMVSPFFQKKDVNASADPKTMQVDQQRMPAPDASFAMMHQKTKLDESLYMPSMELSFGGYMNPDMSFHEGDYNIGFDGSTIQLSPSMPANEEDMNGLFMKPSNNGDGSFGNSPSNMFMF